MLVGRNTYNVTCDFRLNGDIIKVVNDSKDFGIIVNNGLKFQTHINGIVAKVHARANPIHRYSVSQGNCTFVKAFTMFSPYPYWNIANLFGYHINGLSI